VASWHRGKLTKWQVGKVASWQSGKLAKWQVGKVASWQNGVAPQKCALFSRNNDSIDFLFLIEASTNWTKPALYQILCYLTYGQQG
jgi:hypothetical protein